MFKSRGSIDVSILPNSTLLVGWCRPRRRMRRRRVSTIKLGNRRRGFSLGSRPVVHWSCMAVPLRVLKKFMADIGANGRWLDACLRSLPILRPQAFPLCWFLPFFVFFLGKGGVVDLVLNLISCFTQNQGGNSIFLVNLMIFMGFSIYAFSVSF